MRLVAWWVGPANSFHLWILMESWRLTKANWGIFIAIHPPIGSYNFNQWPPQFPATKRRRSSPTIRRRNRRRPGLTPGIFTSSVWPFSWFFSPSVPRRICRALSTLSVFLVSFCVWFRLRGRKSRSSSNGLGSVESLVFHRVWIFTSGGGLRHHFSRDLVFVFHILLCGCFFGGASSRLEERSASRDYWLCPLCGCQFETNLVITVYLSIYLVFEFSPALLLLLET